MSIEDTTPTTVPVTDGHPLLSPPSPPHAGPAPDSISRWWFALGALMVLITAAVIAAFALPASAFGAENTYLVAPGSATNTAPAIRVTGADSFPPESRIAFTTVTIKRDLKFAEWLFARWDDTSELVPPEQIDGNRTSDETRQVTQFQMNQSQDTAALVALNYLGYEIVPEIDGAFVVQLVDGSPAQASLQLGDLIVMVDDVEIRSSEDLGVAIQSRSPGDDVEVFLKRSATEGTGSGADPDATEVAVTITLTDHPDIEGAGFLGVSIETPIRADSPFDVSIDVGSVRGPSAGLAFALSILDVITEGELTGGVDIATTGTIDRFGNIGPVGGVPQKTEAAVGAGIDVFLVPPFEYVEAVETARDRMEVRCVQTFADAVIALAEFGGNGLEVAEANGAPTPELSPNPIDPDDPFYTCAEAKLDVG